MDFNAIFNMFKQPSTWAGVGILLQAFGVHVVPDQVVQMGTMAAGLGAMLINEVGAK
jgi:hypothetical protein